MTKFVSWRRVSTQKQNGSGLGLAAQKAFIRYFVEQEHGDWIADYRECYTGTELAGCGELAKAMARAKAEDAILIIAKTDRFRNTIEALQVYEQMGEGRIMFCDLIHTDKFTLTLFFALAEREALLNSIRTKQALAAKKARGEATGGASERWQESFKKKSKEQKNIENMNRGLTKNNRHLESKDVMTFIKVLRNIFPDATQGDICEWNWQAINTKYGTRQKILSLMKDYRDIDPMLFARWDFNDKDGKPLQVKLAGYLCALRNSIKCKVKLQEKEEKKLCKAI